VFGCANSDYKLLNWARSHECLKQTIDECGCTPPFKLFAFPGEKNDPLARSQWTKLVNRRDSKNANKVWKPNKNLRVCSKHFVDFKPTEGNPNPTLHLGYQNVPSIKTRKRPANRTCTSSTKAKKSLGAHLSEDDTTNKSNFDQPATILTGTSSVNESMEIEEHSATSFNTLTETSSASLNLSEGNISTN
jgi:hypothetical protein